jgi:uncharacterized protein YoxC
MDDFFASAVGDVGEAVERLNQSADTHAFARNIAALVEGASSWFTVPVTAESDQLVVRTGQAAYRLSITCDQ